MLKITKLRGMLSRSIEVLESNFLKFQAFNLGSRPIKFMVCWVMDSKKQIENREDIQLLVDSFYQKVRKDTLIGPIFNDVAKVDWDEHLPKLYNFWSDLLLGEDSYRGRPFPPHMKLNLQPSHFERWLKLFIETVDEHFVGMKADEVKFRALRIARNFMANLSLV